MAHEIVMRELADVELDAVAGGAGHGTFTPPPGPSVTFINIGNSVGAEVGINNGVVIGNVQTGGHGHH
jgi:hypothetical protein